ncbi:MAG TPA: class I SAM-dependent methyltransferase [Aquabacterium sp.]|nr:class I SAM-dependent methyltransferase [Aquabacterium sp.]
MNQASPTYRYLVRDSLRKIRTQLGLRRRPEPAAPIGPAPINSRNVGFLDGLRKGWFNSDTHELFKGFPITSTDTVVDVGCGLGGHLRFCAKYASRSIGVDIDPSRVRATEQALREAGVANFQVIQSDGNPLPLESELATKVICTEVLEHVDDPRAAMRELVRVGKPGALYMLSVPGQLSEEILKQLAPAACFEKPNHIRVFSSDDFRQLVSEAGLEIEQHEFCGFYWAVWHAMIWKCGVDYDTGTHPVLEHWARTWEALSALPEGARCIQALDQALHKSQVIIARKPA